MAKIKRRSFIKLGAAGLSAAALSQFMSPLIDAKEKDNRPYVDRVTYRKVNGMPSTCNGCKAGCGIIGYVREGQLMKVGGNPAHPVNKGTLCLVGQAGFYRQYDPERLDKPMARIGQRGQGRWKEITWEEAIAAISEKLAKASGNVVVETRGGGSNEAAARDFVAKFDGTLVSHGSVISAARENALEGMFGVRTDFPDIENTSYILNFGANPFESDQNGVMSIAAITGHKDKGSYAKLVTFDPRLSATAGRSDEWVPVLPGTDAVVALAMANVIMEEGLYDNAFIAKHTNLKVAELKSRLSAYSPASAERISGVDADAIRRIAREYAKADKAVVLTGGGISCQGNGENNERAVRLLPIITGKINRTGCNLLAELPSAGPAVKSLTPDAFAKKLQEGKAKAWVYIVHSADPLYNSPMQSEMARALSDESAVPFIVATDTHVSDTGKYADIILPLATYLEEFGVEASYGPGGATVIGYRQPVVPVKGEAKPFADMLAEVATKAGRKLSFEDSESLAGQQAARFGANADSLAEKGFLHKAASINNAKINVSSIPGFALADEYKTIKLEELLLVTYKPAGFKAGFTENNILLKEIFHQNRAFINTDTAQKLNIKNWDKLALSSPAGKVEAIAVVSPGVQPKTLALAEGCGHEGFGHIEKAERFEGEDSFTKAIWWGNDGSGVNPNKLRVFNLGREAGGAGFALTKVTVEKA
ncbi:MAG TPA: molybdopterin-dependent oxidoreductase [Nitrospirota bacterium]|jgi:anaerobic selenocysteine-containing dehydrogenase